MARKAKVIDVGAPDWDNLIERQVPRRKKGSRSRKPPEVLALTEVERLTLLRLGAEIRAMQLQTSAKTAEAEAFIRKVDPKNQYHALVGEVTISQAMLQKYIADNNALVDTIGKRLGIDLKSHAFDPDTGILRELSEPKPLPPPPTPAG